MDDQQIRATLIDLVTNLDPDVEYELRHEDFVAEMPQSKERIRCQWPSVSPQWRPSGLPTGGHPFSPLAAVEIPHRERVGA
jgi:hypothetical protein